MGGNTAHAAVYPHVDIGDDFDYCIPRNCDLPAEFGAHQLGEKEPEMLYHVKPGQLSYGEAIGILLLENYVPYVPGDVANASTYRYPVRFQRVPGFTVKRIMAHDMTVVEELTAAAVSLQAEGVRAITGDCGFMALYQDHIASKVDVPVFLSSLTQIPFMRTMLKPGAQIGIVTANSKSLDDSVFKGIGIKPGQDLVVKGLEDSSSFYGSVFE